VLTDCGIADDAEWDDYVRRLHQARLDAVDGRASTSSTRPGNN